MKLHKYPTWLSLHPLIAIVGGLTTAVLLHFFVSEKVGMAVGLLSVAYLFIRQMLYPWAVQIVEWFRNKRKK